MVGGGGHLREDPGGPDCPLLPTFPPFHWRLISVFESNPCFVALSAAFTLKNYLSRPTLIDRLPEDVRLLMDKILEFKEVLEWRFRVNGEMPDMTVWAREGIHLLVDAGGIEELKSKNPCSNGRRPKWYVAHLPPGDADLKEYTFRFGIDRGND